MKRKATVSFTLCISVTAVVAAAVATQRLVLAGDKASTTVSKQAALDNIARSVLLPAYSQLAARSADFSAAATALTTTPTSATLANAQKAWKEMLLAWRRTQAFAHGPVNDLGVYGRIQFWPTRRQSVDRVLRAARPIDDAYIQELGANAVGLSALEILLFDTRQDDAARVAAFSGAQGERQRKYFLALVQELLKQTRDVENAWKGSQGFAVKFAGGGQDTLNLIVNDLLNAIEVGAQGRLLLAVDKRVEQHSRSELVEGGPSGTSQAGVLALLVGARAVFSGADGVGIDDYLQQIKLPVARRVDAQFQKAIDAVRAIDGPLEETTDGIERAVRRAHDECRALEIMIKTEVASTLGVTLTFKSSDGD
jgi:predicted lipoprotein